MCGEVDGPMHVPVKDAKRDAALMLLGVETIRVPSFDLFEDTYIEGVRWIKKIERCCEERSEPETSSPSLFSFAEGEGGPKPEDTGADT